MHEVGAGWLMTTLDPTPAVVERFRSSLERLASAVADGDEDTFTAAMQSANDRIRGDSETP